MIRTKYMFSEAKATASRTPSLQRVRETGGERVTDMGGVYVVNCRILYAKIQSAIGYQKWRIIRLHLLAVNHPASSFDCDRARRWFACLVLV